MKVHVEEYKIYLRGIRNLSKSTSDSYIKDISDYVEYLQTYRAIIAPQDITLMM